LTYLLLATHALYNLSLVDIAKFLSAAGKTNLSFHKFPNGFYD